MKQPVIPASVVQAAFASLLSHVSIADTGDVASGAPTGPADTTAAGWLDYARKGLEPKTGAVKFDLGQVGNLRSILDLHKGDMLTAKVPVDMLEYGVLSGVIKYPEQTYFQVGLYNGALDGVSLEAYVAKQTSGIDYQVVP